MIRKEVFKMEWIPVVFVVFKFAVLVTGMYYAVKWHYDQGKKGRAEERRAVLRASAKVGVLFMLALLGLGLVTFALIRILGMDLTSL
jgi:fatty acid desaturase